MPTAPTAPSAVPDFPALSNRTTYNAMAFAWAQFMQATFPNEMEALAANAYGNALESASSASASAESALDSAGSALAAAASVQSAIATANATKWISGTTYAQGANAWSTINFVTYKRKIAGAGTTDPSADSTNWSPVFPIPDQAGKAGRVLSTNGAALSWEFPTSAPRSARTANTILGVADRGSLIDVTSGTFTQTFDAAATLGNGWYCWYRNAGSGEITIPSSDGVSNWKMYAGEMRLFLCDGSSFTSCWLKPFYGVFASSGTFVKPPGYGHFEGELFGGGASGAKGNYAAGSGGGACVPFNLSAALFGATEVVTIGAGGTAISTANTAGNPGGNSTLGSLVTAYGGGPGFFQSATSSCAGGGGGGVLGAGSAATINNSTGGAPSLGTGLDNTGFGGAGGTSSGAGDAVFGGGAGGPGLNSTNGGPGGRSVYGGGGGGGIGTTNGAAGGTSTFAGSGGASSRAAAGTAGAAPAGGGGATATGTTSGAGARGELRIWGA